MRCILRGSECYQEGVERVKAGVDVAVSMQIAVERLALGRRGRVGRVVCFAIVDLLDLADEPGVEIMGELRFEGWRDDV